MADTKTTALTAFSPIPEDLIYGVDDPNGAPASKKFFASQLMRDRYKIAVSVATSDLTVTLQHLDGTAPTSTKPLYFKVGDAVYSVTSSLTFTLNDGTNYFGGGTTTSTQARQYFVYLTYRTASSALVLGMAAFPYFRTYADGSATTTAEKYFPHSTAPASSDVCVNIGRFTATLSAGAAYTWSISGTGDVINYPIFNTDNLAYNVTWTSSGTQPAIGNGTLVGNYRVTDRGYEWRVRLASGGTSTYGTGTYTMTVPFTAATFTNGNYPCFGSLVDISAGTAYVLIINIGTGGSSVSPFSNGATGVTATSPITLASGDIFSLTGTALLAIP